MVHRLFTTGSFDFEYKTLDEHGATKLHRVTGKHSQLHGRLGFIDGVDVFNSKITPPKINPNTKKPELSSKELMYRRFLIFKEFYTAPTPVVLCEGKTDNVYITHAIRSLASEYPKLANVDSSGTITIKLRRFRYTDSSTGRILRIHGGTGNLGDFIRNYKTDTSRFKAPGMRWPVILLIDNDSGAEPILESIKQINRKKPEVSDPYTHIVANLYLVTTPISSGETQSTIEDFFDGKTKSTVWKGKTFNTGKDFNRDMNYGKADFALNVVKANADSIDFSGFRPILDRFVQVLDEHARRFPLAPST